MMKAHLELPIAASSDVPYVMFVHVPRTGGNTLRNYLRHNLGGGDLVLNNLPACEKFMQLERHKKVQWRLISGHAPFGFDPDLPRRFRHFTMLRDPVERAVSAYSYVHSDKGTGELARQMREHGIDTFRDFIRTDEPWLAGRLFGHLAYLGSGEKGASLWEMAETAIKRLVSDFEFVGCTDLYVECIEYLNRRYGFEGDGSRVENSVPKTNEPTESDLAYLRERLAPEIHVYRFVREMVRERIGG